ncbi:MAG TPA: hypothetical protein PK131_01450 [Candidatus Woesebacteria bacterium]|nr:hypothetical protein [Candidatus Woesebacteria bacterium]
MLPKTIKPRKIKSEQLDLVDEISEKEWIHRKQFWLFVSLILTVGLSLVFYFYRYWSQPHLSSSVSPAPTVPFNLEIDDQNEWSVYVRSGDFVYQKNFTDQTAVESAVNFLNQTDPIADSFLYKAIPKGVVVRQIITSRAGSYQGYFRLSIPGREIYILIRITGQNNLDFSIELIPGVVEKIYWWLV